MNQTETDTQAGGFRCGFVTIIGRPNVGKSTLLNRLVGQKLSITSRKPQTTRWHMLGIDTGRDYQIAYIDTPGIQTIHDKPLNRHMTREATESLARVDLALFVIDGLKWTDAEDHIGALLSESGIPVVLVINKVDRITDKKSLLPFIERLQQDFPGSNIIPVSARTGENMDRLQGHITGLLPFNPPLFPEDQITDRSQRFLAAEIIREKLTRKLGDELPYNIAVSTEEFRETDSLIRVHCTIWVESQGQKAIVIGKGGALLKSVGEQARHDMQELFARQVHLNTWVKVKKNWSRDEASLIQLGYGKCSDR